MLLDDIEIFVKIVESKGFSSASKLLRIPKSTLSRRLSQMEERLGIKLLNRTTRSLSPTPIGQAYYDKCVVVIERLEEVNDVVKGLHTTPKGRLRLTIPYEFGLFFFSEITADFLKEYPDVLLELELANRMVDLVGEGFDLAIRIGHLEDSSFIAIKILQMEGGIYASPEFLQNRAIPQHPSELIIHECLQFRPLQTQVWNFSDKDGNAIKVEPQGRMQVNSMHCICQGAVHGLGIAAINKRIAAPYVKQGKLIEILKDYELAFPSMYAVYPSRKFLSPTVRIFIDYVKARLENL